MAVTFDVSFVAALAPSPAKMPPLPAIAKAFKVSVPVAVTFTLVTSATVLPAGVW